MAKHRPIVAKPTRNANFAEVFIRVFIGELMIDMFGKELEIGDYVMYYERVPYTNPRRKFLAVISKYAYESDYTALISFYPTRQSANLAVKSSEIEKLLPEQAMLLMLEYV